MKREEALRIIKECKEKGFKHTFYTLNEYHTALDIAIKVLEQEPKTGHWEHGRELSRVFISGVLKGINYEDWHCSNCHCVVEQSIKPKWSYCPNCGAKMIEPQERSDKE